MSFRTSVLSQIARPRVNRFVPLEVLARVSEVDMINSENSSQKTSDAQGSSGTSGDNPKPDDSNSAEEIFYEASEAPEISEPVGAEIIRQMTNELAQQIINNIVEAESLSREDEFYDPVEIPEDEFYDPDEIPEDEFYDPDELPEDGSAESTQERSGPKRKTVEGSTQTDEEIKRYFKELIPNGGEPISMISVVDQKQSGEDVKPLKKPIVIIWSFSGGHVIAFRVYTTKRIDRALELKDFEKFTQAVERHNRRKLGDRLPRRKTEKSDDDSLKNFISSQLQRK